MALMVDTTIPYGNACDVAISYAADGATVEFAADPHGGPECLWFCFRLRDQRNAAAPIGPVKLVLKHLLNILGGSDGAKICPVVRLAGGDWRRLPGGQTVTLPDGRRSVEWSLDVPAPHVDVAVCYPYGMAEVEGLVRESAGYWRMDTIGVSQASRPIVRISNSYGEAGADRPGLYLISRQHSAETPGSWVLDGFLRHIAALGDAAPLVWCAPLANIDGVEQGDYGKDNFPYDLNRAWGPVPMRHETLVLQRDIRRWRERCRASLAIDSHAPGLCEDAGSYAFLPSPRLYGPIGEQSRRIVEIAARGIRPDAIASPFGRVAEYASRWETPTFTAFMASLGICAFSLETPYGAINGRALSREDYRQIGGQLAEGIVGQLGA